MYYFGLLVVFHAAQKLLPYDIKANNHVALQVMKLDVFLNSCWPSVSIGIPKKLVLIWTEKYLSNRLVELGSESKSKQTESKILLLPCPCTWAATRRDPVLGYVSLLQIIWLRKSIKDMSSSLGFSRFQK